VTSGSNVAPELFACTQQEVAPRHELYGCSTAFAANAPATDIWYLVKFAVVLMSTGGHSLKVLMSLLYTSWLTSGTLISAASESDGL